MKIMEKAKPLPDPNQLSMLTGVILLAYAISQYLSVPVNQLSIQLPGIFIPINFEYRHLVTVTVSILAATGMDWIISRHIKNSGKERAQHWLLPSMTAWIIGIPLSTIPVGLTWWGVFLFGGLIFTLVIIAEYITVDPLDPRSGIVNIGLSALSLILFLILAISVRASGARLYLVLPAIGVAGVLVSLRTFNLKLGSSWYYAWSFGISFLVTQFAAGLYYLPVSPVQFGILLVGSMYSLLSFSESVIQKRMSRRIWLEPVIIFVFSLLFAIILG